MRSRRGVVGAAVALAVIGVVAVLPEPGGRFAARSLQLRIIVETAQGVMAITAAYLVYGRVRTSRLRRDFVVLVALGLLGASNLFFLALPVPTGDPGPLVFETWAPLAARSLAVAALAWAAWAPETPLPHRLRRPGLIAVVIVDLVLAGVAIAVAVLAETLPAGLEVVANGDALPSLRVDPVLETWVVITGLIAASGAVGLLRRRDVDIDRNPLALALGSGLVLLAGAYACFAAYPSLFTDVVQSGDALRFGFYLVLLLGGERELDRYWNRLGELSVFEERRRLARELHDGVAQELAYVVGQARRLAKGTAPPGTDEQIAAAAERALDESRRAIMALSMRHDEPFDLAVARAAEDVAGRTGVAVHVDIPEGLEVEARVQEAMVRIVQEAVGNAGRHAGASRVDVVLGDDGVLRVTDDGDGFETETSRAGAFGLVFMKERAERVGARLSIDTRPGAGTTVEVALP